MNILSMILIAFTFFNSRSKKFSQLIIEKINDDPDLFIILSFIFMLVAAMSTISFYYNYLIRKERNKFLEVDEMKINQDYNGAYDAQDLEDESSIYPKISHEDFFSYSDEKIKYLERQINVSDRKASILLEEGKIYIKYGIYFYITIIIIWQFLVHIFGFNVVYIYGIISTSFLFMFIEFLGAWFLRQYKQFVDTSTYLIKIKSIFQRYIFAYLVLKNAKEKGFDASDVVLMLRDDIKWPETYLIKNQDTNFAKEYMETITNLANSLNKNNKNNDKND